MPIDPEQENLRRRIRALEVTPAGAGSVGPQGPKGDTGAQGPPGAAGAPGPAMTITRLAQNISGRTLPQGTTSISLTAIPTGKLVQLFMSITFRIPAGSQYCQIQIFDGVTQVGSAAMSQSAPSGAQHMSITHAVGGWTFTATPELRLWANVASTPIDTFMVTGVAFG